MNMNPTDQLQPLWKVWHFHYSLTDVHITNESSPQGVSAQRLRVEYTHFSLTLEPFQYLPKQKHNISKKKIKEFMSKLKYIM